MFDTSAKSNDKSALERGINSWISFGMTLKGAGPTKVIDIATIAKQQISKARVKKKFNALSPKKKPTKIKTAASVSKAKKKPALNRSDYGVWYLKPTDWEGRFKTLSRCAKVGASSETSPTANALRAKGDLTKQATSDTSNDDAALAQLYSTKAFAEFLRKRPNYRPPSFMAEILPKE